MNYTLYSLKTLFNTHVGSGQSSYGIVDKVVQKDHLSAYPCIHSTSLKGALREWVEVALQKKGDATAIFGQENDKQTGEDSKKDGKKNKPGTHHFFQAQLLSYPMRSDKVPFFNVTCPDILRSFKSQLNDFGITALDAQIDALLAHAPIAQSPKSLAGIGGAIVEAHNIKTVAAPLNISDNIKLLFGANLVIMHDDDFIKLIQRLPIITRNHLENGQSTNLFYEEVVPRETHFAFCVGTQTTGPTFDSLLDNGAKTVQVGANATVGYGFSKLQKITFK